MRTPPSARNSRLLVRAAVAAASSFALLALGIGPAGSAAWATPGGFSVTSDPVRAAGGWLATQFVDKAHLPAPDGDHFDQKLGGSYFPNYGANADVIFGLAAAKVGANKIATALDYLAQNVEAYTDISNADGFGPFDGSIGKLAVAAIVAGADPTHFGGADLLAALKKDECPAASTSCTPGAAANIFSSISESFVVLAEARGGADAPSADALAYLSSLQCESGGFTDKTTACTSGAADIDATAYAVMALTAAGGHAGEIADAVAWLEDQQAAGGYWVAQGGPNVNTTGLAAASLAGTGGSSAVGPARSWLRAQQVPAGAPGAGALRYAGTLTATTTSAASPSVLATAQGLNGLVDGGGLATLSASGAADGIQVFAPSAALSAGTVEAGHAQTARGAGFAAGERVRVTIHSDPVTVATATADPLGSVRARYTVPVSIDAGHHVVTLTGRASGLSADRQLTVTSAAAAPSGSISAPRSATPPTAGVIAATGQDRRQLLVLSGIGILAVLSGAGLLVTVRRRTR